MTRTVLTVLSCLALAGGLAIPIFAEAIADGDEGSSIARNVLEPLGNQFAPNAWGESTHNVVGDSLDIVFNGQGLVPQKEYAIKSTGHTLGTGTADGNGNIKMSVSVTDPAVLQEISDNLKRKFDLWQANHRLARSCDIYQFEYSPLD